ncbi:MAG: DUF3857 domain-containing protein [Caldithrix sp.]|nr:DUF3857 domain-containing protein [Caldithrix sp.]
MIYKNTRLFKENMTMKWFYCLMILVGTFASNYATTTEKKMTENADAVYLNILKEYRLNEDGSWTYHQKHQLKILTYYAFQRRYGETFVIFDTLKQALKINKNMTTMADGKKVKSPDNAFNKVLPRFAQRSPAYNHLREMVITHTALEQQAVINLDYELLNSADFLPAMMDDIVLTEDAPIRQLTVRLIVPDGHTLNYQLLNSNAQAKDTIVDGNRVVEWQLSNLSAHHQESAQPPAKDFQPRMIFSTAAHWNALLKPFHEQWVQAMHFEQPPQMDWNGSQTELDSILAVQKVVVQQLEDINVPLAKAGFSFRSAANVWKSAAGTPLEKAIVMSAILHNAGIKAHPVLVSSTKMLAAEVPDLSTYESAQVQVKPRSHQTILLSVNALNNQTMAYRWAGYPALHLGNDQIERIQIEANGNIDHGSEMNIHLMVDKNWDITGHFLLHLQGLSYPYLALYTDRISPNQILKDFNIENVDIDHFSEEKMVMKGTISGTLMHEPMGKYTQSFIPESEYGLKKLGIPTLTVNRNNALKLPVSNFADRLSMKMELPQSVKAIMKPVHKRTKNAVGSVEIEIRPRGKSLIVNRSFSLQNNDVSVKDYPSLLELWRLWHSETFKTLLFEKRDR